MYFLAIFNGFVLWVMTSRGLDKWILTFRRNGLPTFSSAVTSLYQGWWYKSFEGTCCLNIQELWSSQLTGGFQF